MEEKLVKNDEKEAKEENSIQTNNLIKETLKEQISDENKNENNQNLNLNSENQNFENPEHEKNDLDIKENIDNVLNKDEQQNSEEIKNENQENLNSEEPKNDLDIKENIDNALNIGENANEGKENPENEGKNEEIEEKEIQQKENEEEKNSSEEDKKEEETKEANESENNENREDENQQNEEQQENDSQENEEQEQEVVESTPAKENVKKEEEYYEPEEEEGKYNGIDTDILDQHVIKFEQTQALPPYSYQTILATYIQHKNVESVINGDYLEAQRYENLSKQYSIVYSKQAAKEKILTKSEELDKSIHQIRNQIAEVRASYEEKIKQEKEKDADEIHTLMNGHEKAINAFNQYWSDPENVRQYSKGSKQLIQMRAKQKSLLLAKMFDEAAQIRKEADNLEREETLKAQETIQFEIDTKRKALEKKQSEELVRVRLHSVKIVNELKAQMDREIEILEARIRKLKQDRSSVNHSNNSMTLHLHPNAESVDSSVSPRSRRLYDKYRKSTKPKRLILKPLCPALVKPANKRPRSSFQATSKL